MADHLRQRYSRLLDGTYDFDRIVLNAYNRVCNSAGGSTAVATVDELLWRTYGQRPADAHARSFQRSSARVCQVHRIPVIDCRRGEANTTWPKTFSPRTRSGAACFGSGRARRDPFVGRALCSFRRHLVCGASGLDREGAYRMIALSRKTVGK